MIITDKAQIKIAELRESNNLRLSGTDELECYELIEIDLKLPADATFTRSSVAYFSDGRQVPANTPRFEAGKFGKAIMVEEGTTNLININNFTFANGASLVDIVHPVTGKTVKAIKLPQGANVPVASSQYLNLSTNTNYTVSFDLWASDNSNTAINIDLYPDTLPETSKTPTTNVQRHTWTLSSSNSDMGNCRLRFFDNSSQPMPNDVYISMIQLEQKPYATSFIDGTRAAETLTIPAEGVLNPQEGTVECWLYPFNTVKTLDYDRLLFSSAPALPGVFWCNIKPNQQLRFVYDNNGVIVALTGGTVPNLSWSRITIRWNTSGVACFINGVLAVSDPRPITAISGAVLRIGSDNTQYHANILIDDLRISNRARTDEEILAAYQSGKPLPADEWTTYKLDFDDKVRITTQGQIICNELIEI